MTRRLGFILLAMLWPVPALADGDLFRDRVAPILVEQCLNCHSGDDPKGKLDLTRRAKLLAGGENGPALDEQSKKDSLILEKVKSGEMPPKGALPDDEIEAISKWVEAGAHYQGEPLQPNVRRAGKDWWSLRPIQNPPVPKVDDPKHWARNPIDAFVLAKLRENNLSPSPEADRRTLIRRLSFDLIGLPPSPEEIQAFVEDADPKAYEKLVEKLLASPRYGERWGRHWLDVVRFGESHGYETNALRPNAWPYRDYVIRAFNDDTPLPQFIREQLAGDTIPKADWLAQAATGFIVGGTHDVVGNLSEEGKAQQRVDDLDDMITATGTAFLGLTVQCARCHDHKFDPISQRDYYGLQAVFAGVNHADRSIAMPDTDDRRREADRLRGQIAEIDRKLDESEPLADPGLGAPGRPMVSVARNVERFPTVEAKYVRFTILETNNGSEPCIDELEIYSAGDAPRNVALGGKATASSEYPGSDIHKTVHLNDGRTGNSRSWISRVPHKGWAQIELPKVERIDRVVWGRDRDENFKDRLAVHYLVEVAIRPGEWHVVASSADRPHYEEGSRSAQDDKGRSQWKKARSELAEKVKTLTGSTMVYAGTFNANPGPSHILRRGDPLQKLAKVAPSGIAAIRPALELPENATDPERRRALADWLGHRDNPLPARVMVNRAWHYHFGRGLVATPGDFGFQGVAPSHPELLDWLASAYRDGGYRLKPIHRLIVLSSTYRQSSTLVESAAAIDRDNRLLWRKSPRRLEAEAIRDAMLAASGSLNLTMGGPGYTIWEKNTNYVVVFIPRADLGPDTFRRMVYQFKPRSQADPTFGAFDCPDAAMVVPRRNVSTTALQALNLLNSRFLLDQSARLAARVDREAGSDPAARASRAFLLTFGREPGADENGGATELVKSHGTASLARALLNANEFLYVD